MLAGDLLVEVCTAHRETAEAARKRGGFQYATTFYEELLEREDIDVINCCTPYLPNEALYVCRIPEQ